jgi:translation initiation factor 2 subunit 2
MAELSDRTSRKSVSFADSHAIVDEDGNVNEKLANGGNEEATAESHSTDAAVDEVTDMFASLAKKKKPKKKKDGEDAAEADAAAPAAEEGELDLSSLSRFTLYSDDSRYRC